MTNALKPIYIFLRDDEEILEFCKFIINQLLIDIDIYNLSENMEYFMGRGYSLCSLSIDKKLNFSLEVLPVVRYVHCYHDDEHLVFIFGTRPKIHAISFDLARKKLSKIVQCGKII